nr:diacylglycerol kinase family lipid kinase [Bacteroidota bacterium]
MVQNEIKSKDSRKWYVLVNPNAGNRKIKQDWKKINTMLEDSSLQFEHVFTKGPLHAIELTLDAITTGFRKFLVIGGDGTLNEVVNAYFLQQGIDPSEFLTGLIPVGTGNDWGRMFKIPVTYQEAIKVVERGRVFTQDVGKVVYHDNDMAKTRYFINIAGMGFDALVAQKTNKQKEKGKASAFSYFANLLTSLFEYKPKIIGLDIDGKKFSYNTFSITVGICRYNGGGMMQSPKAIPDDGLLDLTLIKKIGFATIIAQLKNLYSGKFISHPKVMTYRAERIAVDSGKAPFRMEADGESLGSAPFTFTILPRAINVVIAEKTF